MIMGFKCSLHDKKISPHYLRDNRNAEAAILLAIPFKNISLHFTDFFLSGLTSCALLPRGILRACFGAIFPSTIDAMDILSILLSGQ